MEIFHKQDGRSVLLMLRYLSLFTRISVTVSLFPGNQHWKITPFPIKHRNFPKETCAHPSLHRHKLCLLIVLACCLDRRPLFACDFFGSVSVLSDSTWCCGLSENASCRTEDGQKAKIVKKNS